MKRLNTFLSRLRQVNLAQLAMVLFGSGVFIAIVWATLAYLIAEVISPNQDQRETIELATTLVGFGFALIAGLIILFELNDAVDSRNLEIYRDIYEKTMKPEAVEARRYLYQDLPNLKSGEALINYLNKHKDARSAYKQTMSMIDYFGFLVDQEWVSSEEIIGWLSPIVVKVWERIQPIYEYELEQRGPAEADYHQHAHSLYLKCRAWRNGNRDIANEEINYGEDRI